MLPLHLPVRIRPGVFCDQLRERRALLGDLLALIRRYGHRADPASAQETPGPAPEMPWLMPPDGDASAEFNADLANVNITSPTEPPSAALLCADVVVTAKPAG